MNPEYISNHNIKKLYTSDQGTKEKLENILYPLIEGGDIT